MELYTPWTTARRLGFLRRVKAANSENSRSHPEWRGTHSIFALLPEFFAGTQVCKIFVQFHSLTVFIRVSSLDFPRSPGGVEIFCWLILCLRRAPLEVWFLARGLRGLPLASFPSALRAWTLRCTALASFLSSQSRNLARLPKGAIVGSTGCLFAENRGCLSF